MARFRITFRVRVRASAIVRISLRPSVSCGDIFRFRVIARVRVSVRPRFRHRVTVRIFIRIRVRIRFSV